MTYTSHSAYVCAKSLQLCLTLYDTVDCSLPGSSVRGILQARILEWVVMPSSKGIFPTQGSNPYLLRLLALASGFFTTSATWKAFIKKKWVELLHVYKVYSKIDFQILLES